MKPGDVVRANPALSSRSRGHPGNGVLWLWRQTLTGNERSVSRWLNDSKGTLYVVLSVMMYANSMTLMDEAGKCWFYASPAGLDFDDNFVEI